MVFVTADHPEVDHPDAALMEWLETHGFKRLVGRIATTGLLGGGRPRRASRIS